LAPDSLGPGCELTIRTKPALCRCRDCSTVVEIGELIYYCPHCGSQSIQLEGGRELLLQSIEVDEESLPGDSSVEADQGG